MKNVRKLKDVVDATPGLPDVAAIIKAKFSNNVSTGGRCKAGIDDIMTMSGFEQAVRELSGKEGAGDFADYKKILLHAKQKKGTFWPWAGQRGCVRPDGAKLHAAAGRRKRLHATPADDGIGEEPPQDDWGIVGENESKFYTV